MRWSGCHACSTSTVNRTRDYPKSGSPQRYWCATLPFSLIFLVVRQIYRPGEDLVRWVGGLTTHPVASSTALPTRFRRAGRSGFVPPQELAPSACSARLSARKPLRGRGIGATLNRMQVAIALFPEILRLTPSVLTRCCSGSRASTSCSWASPREVRTDNGMLGLTCDATFDEVSRPDVVLVPGG